MSDGKRKKISEIIWPNEVFSTRPKNNASVESLRRICLISFPSCSTTCILANDRDTLLVAFWSKNYSVNMKKK